MVTICSKQGVFKIENTMESYIQITQLNDFVFCPRSIYYHGVYAQSYSEESYHQTAQKTGRASHEAIDNGNYSTRSNILCGTTVWSEKYGLLGCIDTFDIKEGLLTERKYSVTNVWPGFRYQLYAQMFALTEMGYTVKTLRLYSKKDNKIYNVDLPTDAEVKEFEEIIAQFKTFSLDDNFSQSSAKCKNCIYSALCDKCAI